MPTICMFRGIKIFINWDDHNPPHIHVEYGDYNAAIDIVKIELFKGSLPNKQLKMVLGWTALHQEELLENWELAQKQITPFEIAPLQ